LGFHWGNKKRGLEAAFLSLSVRFLLYLIEIGKPANFAKIYFAYLQGVKVGEALLFLDETSSSL
jgi:hypothetical protein